MSGGDGQDEADGKAKSSSIRARLAKWFIALAALAVVAYVVPIRDRCTAPDGQHVTVTRTGDGCILHASAGVEQRLPAPMCAQLKCEPGLSSTLANANLGAVAVLAVIYLLSLFAWGARWKLLLRIARVDVPLLQIVRVTLEAQAGGVLLPGGVGGDALRVAYMRNRGAKLSVVIASVLLDRALGLTTLAAIAAAMAFSLDPSHPGEAAWFIGAIPVAVAAGLVFLRFPFVPKLVAKFPAPIARAFEPVLAYFAEPSSPRSVALATLPSFINSGIQLITIRGLLYALGAHPDPERWVYVGATMAMMAAVLPGLPGGWGTTDAAFVFFLARAGIPGPVALSVSLLYRFFWYLSGAIGAVLSLSRSGAQARKSATEATPSP